MSPHSQFQGAEINDELLEKIAWGFVLIRCTYTDDERWSSFLSALKEQNNLSDKLTQSQPWTTIEDKNSLANATMLEASLAFQKWMDTKDRTEHVFNKTAPRHMYFIYVNEESIESIINPSRSREESGDFLVLVDANRHIKSCNELEANLRNDYHIKEDIRDVLADTADASWKLIAATDLKSIYLIYWTELDPWHENSNEFQSAPFVYHRGLLYGGSVDDLLENVDPVGYDVYKMLKQMYGKNHLRSVCFETEEAETGLQKICGYAGGWRRKEYIKPWYL